MAKEIQYRKLTELKKLPNNPRTIKKDDMERLKKSIKDNPDYFEARPIILSNRTGELVILAGNQRYEAAKALKMEEVPTFLLEGLTEAREREIIIRDNVSNGDWDMDALANEWDTQELTDWGVDINWDEPEQELIEDDAPEVNESEPADSELGKVYQLGSHRLMCGDSTDAGSVAILMDGQKADMVFTDPPYGYKYQSNGRVKSDKFDVLKNDDTILDFFPSVKQYCDGWVWVCTTWKTADKWIELFKEYFELTNMIIWDKGGGGIGDLFKTFSTDYEMIMVCNNGKELKGKRYGSVWNFTDTEISKMKKEELLKIVLEQKEYYSVWKQKKDNPNEYAHPTQKPVALSAKAIRSSTDFDGVVLDVFGGSGSTLIACEQLERTCYMMELDPKYCDVIRKRYWKFKTGSEEGWQDGTKAK